MGQVLFAPPNVKGWRTGTDWLNSATLLARNNFAETVATGNWQPIQKGNNGPNASSAKTATVADVADPGSIETSQSLVAGAAVAGAAAAYSPARVMIAPDGSR